MKIVINNCFGGFNISIEALKELVLRNAECVKTMTPKTYYGGDNPKYHRQEEWKSKWNDDLKEYKDLGDGMFGHPSAYNIYKDGLLYCFDDRTEKTARADKDLIEVVESFGNKADGFCASLKVVEIPDGIDWEIDEYDGLEKINEAHRSWS